MVEQEQSNPALLRFGVAFVLVGVGVLLVFRFSGSGGAQVSGTATLDGAPLAGATVVFLREGDENPPALIAVTDAQGRYSVVGSKGGGIPTGKYKVMVAKMGLQDGSVPQGKQIAEARRLGLLQNILPAVYEDRSSSPLVFDVRAGANTIALDLKRQP